MPPSIFSEMLLEVCAYSLASCAMAARTGASRVELCAGPNVGGTTPVREAVEAALELGIPVFPMIRPREGDFLYDQDELAAIRKTVLLYREMGCPGLVTGMQLRNGRLDSDALKRVVELAGPMAVTCHKVFDGVPDAAEALEELVDAGCMRVLTSGLATNAVAGAHSLQQLVAQAGGRITVMPGGGIRSENIAELVRITGAHEYHSSAITPRSDGADADEAELRALVEQLRTAS